jgi:hypothetical protein
MARSPAHYQAAEELNFENGPRRMGTLVHALTLGGELIRYDAERTGNAWKAFKALVDGRDYMIFDGAHRGKAWDEAKLEAGDRVIVTSEDVEAANEPRLRQMQARAEGRRDLTIVSTSEYDQARECADAVLSNPLASWLIGPETERELRWTFMGRECGGRLDIVGDRRLTELKTGTNSSPEFMMHQALRMSWHQQCAWYREGARLNGYPVDDVYVIGVEVRKPYPVTPMRVTPRSLEQGEKTVRVWMERLLGCEAANEWPAYVQSITNLDVPDETDLIFAEDEAA